eukprot:CAMPEP_0116013836 /NCGR_PEP_ID=MMETSP0321-20121206/5948_1 /TAXON_ID=163516 /ORGANISM="Leptocylindrus danicus var. danicus, Strain B650" /LENGTH=766 /DNA_ID=CAMNT_0003483431 /DNA_START=124 /DNA_END=2424 /DNA_ORIENTATION=-
MAPPIDHFATSSSLLIEAARAILHKRSLHKVSQDVNAPSGTTADPVSVTDLCTSREELYKLVESLCQAKHGKELFEKVNAEIIHAAKFVLAKMETTQLSDLLTLYEEFSQYIFYIRNIFLALDRSEKKNIYDFGKNHFRELIIQKNLFQSVVVPNLFQSIKALRVEYSLRLLEQPDFVVEGQQSDFDVKNGVQMVRDLGFYDELEELFVEESRTFYLKEGSSLFEGDKLQTLPKYIEIAQKLLNYNNSLVGKYFNSGSTKLKIKYALEECLVKRFMGRILGTNVADDSSGANQFYALLDKSDQTLHTLYNLFNKINAKDELYNAVTLWGKARGEAFVSESNPIPSLLSLHKKLCNITEIIQNKGIIKIVLETVLNEGGGNKVPQALAKQFDETLRGKNTTATAKSTDSLDALFVLFTFVVNKDTFGMHYRSLLGRRLLKEDSESLDVERSVLSKLKGECGAHYTSKLEGMYNDIELSADLGVHYAEYCKNTQAGGVVEFEPKILTTGYWQQPPQHDLHLPQSLLDHMKHYNDYYTTKYKGRRVVWQHSLGQIVIKAIFPVKNSDSKPKIYQFALSQLMGLILYQFNPVDDEEPPRELTLPMLTAATNIPEDEVIRCLLSLSKSKDKQQRVLLHHKNDTSTQRDRKNPITPEDTFTVNTSYKSNKMRVKIPMMSSRMEHNAKLAEEEEQISEAIMRDRNHAIDAAIVRLLKTRKVIKHHALLAELMSSGVLKFSFQPQDVKKRIESLIEREYIERDANDRNTYKYLA